MVNLLDMSSGSISAHYEYDPFGRLVCKEGSYADDNEYRFSTKRYNAAWNLYDYEYRHHSPDLGRWMSRDSVAETDEHLYHFAGNSSISHCDVIGLYKWGFMADDNGFWDENIGGSWYTRRIMALQAIRQLNDRVPKRVDKLDTKVELVNSLTDCVEIKQQLLERTQFARDTVNTVAENLKNEHSMTLLPRDLGTDSSGRGGSWAQRHGWVAKEIELNTDTAATPFTSVNELAATLFHELTHYAGLPDENSSPPQYKNAHIYKTMYKKGISSLTKAIYNELAVEKTYKMPNETTADGKTLRKYKSP